MPVAPVKFAHRVSYNTRSELPVRRALFEDEPIISAHVKVAELSVHERRRFAVAHDRRRAQLPDLL
ncbi:hypothetical protein WJ47_16820 [Burkholderia ubonensis]|nr:hypothetical protein WJ44_19775 [Burkholderia ubonensis]KVL62254.1 hypothetical protein WJ47_16820 [Burkholderia ubonensis]KVM33610.1 hypothetical protein WJ54_06725 [Burkholderia ubonensis]